VKSSNTFKMVDVQHLISNTFKWHDKRDWKRCLTHAETLHKEDSD